MRVSRSLTGLAVGAAMALAASSADAAPVGGLGEIKADPAAASAVEKTYWAWRCHYYRGHRHCSRYWVRPRFHVGPFLFYGHRHLRFHHHHYRR